MLGFGERKQDSSWNGNNNWTVLLRFLWNASWLFQFSGVGVLLILAEIGAAAYANVYDQKFIALLLNDNFMDVSRMDSMKLKDSIQSTWRCCEKNGPFDWVHEIPRSCYSKPDIACTPLYTQVTENYYISLNRSYFIQIDWYLCCTYNVVPDTTVRNTDCTGRVQVCGTTLQVLLLWNLTLELTQI